ncbi:MAG TPA: lysophospholipid acyltransferase family protein [Usitatibacter sp.]|nr:lysophospholipid acyltransferase family protein [Usitatibacter sp.]
MLRWARLVGHGARAAWILRFVYPRSRPPERRRLARWWARGLLRILGVRVRVSGPLPPLRGEAAMIAANHVSWIDIFAVMSVRPARFIAKSEIRGWPAAGWIAELAGTLFVQRARRHDTARINARVHEALAQGDCIGLFPEGTTTEGDALLRFHTSLFEPAVANAATIHPAAIRYEYADGTPCKAFAYVGETTFLESVARVVASRGVIARIAFAEPIDPSAGIDRREAARLAHARIASLLRLPSPDNPPGRGHGPRDARR